MNQMWLKFIAMLVIHHYDENGLMRWNLIDVINILQRNKDHYCYENLLKWWKFIIVMKIYHWDENL